MRSVSVSVLEVEAVDPGLLGRCAWDVEQAQRDVDVLAWVGRFRFVTAQAIGERFDVSWQQANARIRRLERLGLLGCERQHVSQPRAVFLTGKGHKLLGWPRRRAPRAQVQREHEAAIVFLVCELERQEPDARVLTERECRRLEADGQTRRYSVDVHEAGRGPVRRWPDVVVEVTNGRSAYEIEFAPKGTAQLKQIVEAYETRADYDRGVFMVKSASLGRRIRKLAGRNRPLAAMLDLQRAEVQVVPWIGLPPAQQAQLSTVLAS